MLPLRKKDDKETSGDTSLDLVWDPPTQMSSLDCWDYSIELDCLRGSEDLHLAAELGKTLLERNKELETLIKQYQTTVDDQAVEIQYLKKQVAAMKEVNDSRLRIYENLETVINDLENANKKLEQEKNKDKYKLTSQRKSIYELENRYDELKTKYDDLNKDYDRVMRVLKASSQQTSSNDQTLCDSNAQNGTTSAESSNAASEENRGATSANNEAIKTLKFQLSEARSQRDCEKRMVNELQEQVNCLLQEKTEMEKQIVELQGCDKLAKSLKQELDILTEIREGHMCGRCLRGTNPDETTKSILEYEEDEYDSRSLAESLGDSLHDFNVPAEQKHQNYQCKHEQQQEFDRSSEALEEENCRDESYRMLIEKYEALVKVQQNAPAKRKQPQQHNCNGSNPVFLAAAAATTTTATSGNQCLSLQEELQISGEFNGMENGHGTAITSASSFEPKRRPAFSGTPTDFSEAETSSSGFADETSNKATQTEGRLGSFLCSIADGDDCKFSIYDDNSTFDGRFHRMPEYRKLFHEIFEVLKRAAEAKESALEGPSVAPAAQSDPLLLLASFDDAMSDATDDTNSVVSLAVSSVASEPVFRVRTPLFGHRDDSRHPARLPQQPSTAAVAACRKPQQQQQPEHRPLQNNTRRQPLDYLSVQVRKRSSVKKTRRFNEGPATGSDVIPTTNPRLNQLKSGNGSRRKFRPITAADFSDGVVWNGHTAHFYPSKPARTRQQQQQHYCRTNQQQQQNAVASFPLTSQSSDQSAQAYTADYKPGSASEEVAKLRRLEMSYAEVLRMSNKSKGASPCRQYRTQQY